MHGIICSAQTILRHAQTAIAAPHAEAAVVLTYDWAFFSETIPNKTYSGIHVASVHEDVLHSTPPVLV